jgi:predicted DNA-binding transcriptional regulator AlpA
VADKTFYNLEEAARELDVSVEELKSMISFGKLPEVSNGGERLIPAQAVDDFYKSGASPAKSTAPSADHYTGTEVARKLGKSVPEILQMANQGKLSVKFIDDKRLFPKQAIDQMVVGNHTSNGTKQREEESGEEYFTLEQISHALQRNVADVKREAKTETINEQIWVSKKEVERVISRREPLRQKRIRKRLPKPHLIDKPNVAAHKTGESSMKTVGKRKYYSLEEAAQFLGESVGDVWERIRKKQIPHENIKGEVYVPVLPLHDFYYDKLSPNKNPGRKPMKPATPGNIKAEEALLDD